MSPKHDKPEQRKQQGQMNFIDPVCGMSTTHKDEFISYDREGGPYYFCSDHCLDEFKKNPKKFASKERSAKTPVA